MMTKTSIVLTACALSGMGCDSHSSTTSAQNTLVRPLEEVSASGPPVITDVTASSATLRFDSSVPLVCAVIHGETTGYGLIR